MCVCVCVCLRVHACHAFHRHCTSCQAGLQPLKRPLHCDSVLLAFSFFHNGVWIMNGVWTHGHNLKVNLFKLKKYSPSSSFLSLDDLVQRNHFLFKRPFSEWILTWNGVLWGSYQQIKKKKTEHMPKPFCVAPWYKQQCNDAPGLM